MKHPPLKEAPEEWIKLAQQAWAALGFPDRHGNVIGIDGMPHAGKSSLASWLAWQLGIKAVHLDLYVERSGLPVRWRTDDLRRVVEARSSLGRPLIIEGVMLLDALEQIEREAQFLVFVEKEAEFADSMGEHVLAYLERRGVAQRANAFVRWSSLAYDLANRAI